MKRYPFKSEIECLSIWLTNVKTLLKKTPSIQVLALQEVGTVPRCAIRQPALGDRLIAPQDCDLEVFEYKWNLGTSMRPKYKWIYYTHNDQAGNKINLALVTDKRADVVIFLRPPGSEKPVLGVQIGKQSYFSVLANPQGACDATSVVNVINEYFGSQQDYDTTFFILGDFNREPKDFKAFLRGQHSDIWGEIEMYHTNQPTEKNGSIVDYLMVGQYQNDNLATHLAVYANISCVPVQLATDHKAVLFDINLH